MGFLVGAAEALQEALLEREAKKRQAFLDMLKQREVESQMADREAARKLQERNAQLAERNATSVENLRDYERAKDIVEMAGANEQVTPDTESLLQRAGFGGRIRQDVQKNAQGVPELQYSEGVPQELGGNAPSKPAVIRISTVRPGFRYEQARQAAEERDALAKQAQQAAADQKERDRQQKEREDIRENNMRRDIAALAASGRGANADLQRELLQARIDAAKDKQTSADNSDIRRAEGNMRSLQDTLNVVGQLIDVPRDKNGNVMRDANGTLADSTLRSGTRSIVGKSAYNPMNSVPGTEAYNAKVSLDRLRGKQIIDLMSEMKAQSKTGATGFGALSEKELAVLDQAAAALNTAQSEEAFQTELNRIARTLDGALSRAAQDVQRVRNRGSQQSAAPTATKKYNPATGKVE